MRLTKEQQLVVEQNMGLVGRVIKDRIWGLGSVGAFTYEDLFQIGCIGLCKAAATDRGGCFSTYAYRLIWNEICDALNKATRISQRETVTEASVIVERTRMDMPDPLESCELKQLLEDAKSKTDIYTAKGIQCLMLSADGYTSKELSELFGAKPPAVRMWMTKARRYLQSLPDMEHYLEEVGL